MCRRRIGPHNIPAGRTSTSLRFASNEHKKKSFAFERSHDERQQYPQQQAASASPKWLHANYKSGDLEDSVEKVRSTLQQPKTRKLHALNQKNHLTATLAENCFNTIYPKREQTSARSCGIHPGALQSCCEEKDFPEIQLGGHTFRCSKFSLSTCRPR